MQSIPPPAIGHAHAPPQRCRDATERRVLLERAFALGVPRGYARTHHLRMQHEPAQLVPLAVDIYGRQPWLQPAAARNLALLFAAAAADGVTLQVVSAFRSIAYQLQLIERKLARGQPMADILRVSAAPGYSEHHSGRCVDLTTPGCTPLEEVFEHSAAYRWLQQHAARFGFSLSYPRGNRYGIAYEPWHWCWHAPAHPGQADSPRDASTTRQK